MVGLCPDLIAAALRMETHKLQFITFINHIFKTICFPKQCTKFRNSKTMTDLAQNDKSRTPHPQLY